MKRKLDIAKSRKVQDGEIRTKIELDQTEQVNKLQEVKESIDKLWETIDGKEEYDFDKLSNQLETLNKNLDLSEQLSILQREVKETKIDTKVFGEIVDAVKQNKPLPIQIDLEPLRKAIIQVEQRVQDLNNENTAPEDYKPYRRVIKQGNRLVFDDQPTPSRGGGGGGGGSSGVGLTDAELRASPVPVEATIDTTGLATDATDTNTGNIAISASNIDDKTPALGQALSAGSTPVVLPASQITTLTPPAAITGFATSAKQDDQTALLTTIDADTGAIKTAVETLDNAISGSEMQVDIVAALPAGTNNVGQFSVAPQTANGLSVFNATSSDGATALTNSAQAIKASAGQLYGWYIYNPNASAQFVQLYNTAAASVTVGTTNPLFMLTIPATSGANVEFTNGITFSNTGWSCAATSTAGGNGAPSTALDAVFFYK